MVRSNYLYRRTLSIQYVLADCKISVSVLGYCDASNKVPCWLYFYVESTVPGLEALICIVRINVVIHLALPRRRDLSGRIRRKEIRGPEHLHRHRAGNVAIRRAVMSVHIRTRC